VTERSPLLQRGILALLSAEIISSLGSQMTFLALPWFVLTTTGSTTRMGLVLAAELLPIALLGIPSGTVVTRLGARRAMLVSDAARVPLMASIPLLYTAGVLTFGLLLALVFVLGVFIAPYFSAQRIVLPELVGDEQATLTQANAVVEAGSRLTILLGPLCAGLLIAWIGATNVLYVDAASYAVSFCLLLLFVPRRPPLPATDGGRGLLAGLRFVIGDSLLRPMLITVVFLHMFAQSIIISLPVLAYAHYGASARTAGLLFAAFGAGSVIGSLAAIPLARTIPPVRLATIGIVWVSLPLLLLGLELPAVGVMGVMFAAGLGAVATSPLLALITTRAPAPLRPKVLTAVITIVTISGPLAVLGVGWLLESVDVRTLLFFLAVGRVAMAVAFALIVPRRAGAQVPPVTEEAVA
jgi:Transmembrane secretion effector